MDRDTFIEIFQVILRNPLRTFMASVGVGWGIMMLIVMVGAGNGLENGVKSDMRDRAFNSLYMWSMSTTKAYKGFQPGRRFELTNEDVAYLKENVPEMAVVSPRNQLGGYRGSNNVSRGSKTGAFNVYGDCPEYRFIEPVPITAGRYLNENDMAECRKICIIGEQVKRILFKEGEDPIGQYIQLHGINFKVAGVFGTTRSGEDGIEATQTIYIPLSTFQKAFNYGNIIGWLSMLSKDGVDVRDLEAKVLAILKERKSVHPNDQRAFGYYNMAERTEEMQLVFGAFDIVGFAVGTLVLLAGIIVIINIMLITVNERTREFGVRRALGAQPKSIVTQVVMETLLLTIVSGCAGMMVGVVMLELVSFAIGEGSDAPFQNPEISLSVILLALGVMIIFGAIAGLLPAFRAVAVRPVEALRS
ncbi:MAG: putative ABC transport system permease protein [Flavobacteriales bacterium]|jgi:putative ABC transport system permease protein